MNDADSNTVVILVHGTFARRSAWTAEDSKLSAELRRWNAKTVAFEWSGRNSDKARLEGAAALSKLLVELKHSNPDTEVHLIGHSHGGNVIRYALWSEDAIAADLSSWIKSTTFLGTPFLTYRQNDMSQFWRLVRYGVFGLVMAIWILSYTVITFLQVASSYGLGASNDGIQNDIILSGLLVFGFIGLGCILAIPVGVAARRAQRKLANRLNVISLKRASDLIIVSPEDEALGYLSLLRAFPRAIQFFLNAIYL